MNPFKTFVACAAGLFLVLTATAQEPSPNVADEKQDQELARQKLLKAADSIEDMRVKNGELEKEIASLRKALEESLARQDRLVKKVEDLAEAIKKVDKARILDRDAIVGEINKTAEEMRRLSGAAPPKTPPAPAADTPDSPAEPPAAAGPAATEEFYEHTVEKDQTLWSIARAYKVGISDIKKANNLTSDTLKIGQKLLIPKTK